MDDLATLRRRGIGGTDISRIMGVNPWGGPLDVYLDKLGLRDPIAPTEVMEWGVALEPAILARYASIVNCPVERPAPCSLHDSDYPFLIGSPDGLQVGNPIGVEVKTASSEEGWGEEGTDRIPTHYLLQCQWYLMLSRYRRWDVAVLFRGSKFRLYSVFPDSDLQDQMQTAAVEFWMRNVVPQIPPKMDGSRGAKEYLARKYPVHTGDILAADAEAETLALMLRESRRRLADQEQIVQKIENLFKARIGENAGIRGLGWLATWKQTKGRHEVDWQQIAGELADGVIPEDLIAKHTTTREGVRRFLTKWEE